MMVKTLTEYSNILILPKIASNQTRNNNYYKNSIQKHQIFSSSPAQIRTGVKGSKGGGVFDRPSNDIFDKEKYIEPQTDVWRDFELYLLGLNQSKHSIRSKVNYAKRYHHILDSHNAQELLSCSFKTRVHTMKALASLSKFMGIYDDWKNIVQRHQLKWSDNDKSIKVFNAIFQNEGNTYSSMLRWIRDVISILPKDYQNIILFNTLTGLRPDEAQNAIHLIKIKDDEYIDKEKGLLKHYQFPKIFLRQTKNAYVSIIDENILELAKHTPVKEKYLIGLRKRVIKNNYKMNMYFCRKLFATYLRNKGIEPEIIDLLQGRISSSVFVNHYYRPDINEIITKRIRPALYELRNELIDMK